MLGACGKSPGSELVAGRFEIARPATDLKPTQRARRCRDLSPARHPSGRREIDPAREWQQPLDPGVRRDDDVSSCLPEASLVHPRMHIGHAVRDAFVAVDAGLLALGKRGGVLFHRTLALPGEIHAGKVVAVTAFQ